VRLKAPSAMRFEDSRRWRPDTAPYELPRMRQLALVPAAIFSTRATVSSRLFSGGD
jgi:hypothetical protein